MLSKLVAFSIVLISGVAVVGCSEPEDVTAGNPTPPQPSAAMVECVNKPGHVWVDDGLEGFCTPPPSGYQTADGPAGK